MSTSRSKPEYFFGHSDKCPSFKEKYPQIEDIEMTVTEISFERPDDQPHVYTTREPPGPYFGCSNRQCQEGGFSMWDILDGMVRDRTTSSEIEKECPGHERIGRSKRPCDHSFDITIELKYIQTE